ncbi:hypothetical protein [Stetteria hydrogenophila]
MASLSAEDIVKLFEEDERARKRLAELLVAEPDVRLAVINAVLRDVATKSDIERLRDELREEFRRELDSKLEGLRKEFNARIEGLQKEFNARLGGVEARLGELDKRIDEMGRRLDFIAKLTLALTGSVLAALIVAIAELALA